MGAFGTALHNCGQQVAGHGHVGLVEAVGFGTRCEQSPKHVLRVTRKDRGNVVILVCKVGVCDFE